MDSATDGLWPVAREALEHVQRRLAAQALTMDPPGEVSVVGASYVCFARTARPCAKAGEHGWAAASCKTPGERSLVAVVRGRAEAAYVPGWLALREGPLRTAAVQALPRRPGVVLVDATGRDHPRRAGLALHLGAVLDLPTIGVTDRPLNATAEEPADERGSVTPLRKGTDVVGYAVRCRTGVRPVCVSPGWRMTPELAVDVVLATARRARTPQPLREARRAARAARARGGG